MKLSASASVLVMNTRKMLSSLFLYRIYSATQILVWLFSI
ncbi:hypothetical protein HMPREF3203_01486 [Proteus mirabilis]|nr:hypothetical protein HMPREF3203_01486 [Proteus mirabilis]